MKKVIVITGASSGIGFQSASSLALQGHSVFITGRSEESGLSAVRAIQHSSGNPDVKLLLGDLSTLHGVRSVARQFTDSHQRLDVLINNAGLAANSLRITEDGLESNFAVNVVAPYFLMKLLMPALAGSDQARVVTLTGGNHPKELDLENLQAEKGFSGLHTYSHSKLVMMALEYELSQNMTMSGITVNVCYPGQASTHMTRSVNKEMLPTFMRFVFPLFKYIVKEDGGKSAQKASMSTVFLATSAEVSSISGGYFDKNSHQVAWPSPVLDIATRRSILEKVEKITL